MGGKSSTPARELSLEEVEEHNTRESCWIVRGKKVYDVTRYVSEHPGGEKALLSKGGAMADCTSDFQFHSSGAQDEWKDYAIGKLSSDAQVKFKVKISDLTKKQKIVNAAIDAARPAYIPRCVKRRGSFNSSFSLGTTAHKEKEQQRLKSSTKDGTQSENGSSGPGMAESQELGRSFTSIASETVSLYSSAPTSTRATSDRGSPIPHHHNNKSHAPSQVLPAGTPLGAGGTPHSSSLVEIVSPQTAGKSPVPAASPHRESFKRAEASSSTSAQQRAKIKQATAGLRSSSAGSEQELDGFVASVSSASGFRTAGGVSTPPSQVGTFPRAEYSSGGDVSSTQLGSPLTQKNLELAAQSSPNSVPCSCGCSGGPTCLNRQ